MLSWVTPFPGNAITSNLTARPTRGASVFVFYYIVEKCWTVQGANCTPPRKNTWGGNTFCISSYFNTNGLKHCQCRRSLCWWFPVSNNDRLISKYLVSTSRYLTWLRMSEIHFLKQQSNFRWALGFLPFQAAGGRPQQHYLYFQCTTILSSLNVQQEGEL